VTEGYSIRNEWLQNTSYKIGEIVRRHGNLFVATQDNNSDPTNQVIVKAYRATGSSGTTIKISTSDSSAGNILPGMIVTGPGFTRGQTVVSHPDDVTVILNEAPDGTPIDASTIIDSWTSYDSIYTHKDQYELGQLFYASTTHVFYRSYLDQTNEELVQLQIASNYKRETVSLGNGQYDYNYFYVTYTQEEDELTPYLTVLLNQNRVNTSLLGISNTPAVNKYIQRAILA
jgi:hypothetical protein